MGFDEGAAAAGFDKISILLTNVIDETSELEGLIVDSLHPMTGCAEELSDLRYHRWDTVL